MIAFSLLYFSFPQNYHKGFLYPRHNNKRLHKRSTKRNWKIISAIREWEDRTHTLLITSSKIPPLLPRTTGVLFHLQMALETFPYGAALYLILFVLLLNSLPTSPLLRALFPSSPELNQYLSLYYLPEYTDLWKALGKGIEAFLISKLLGRGHLSKKYPTHRRHPIVSMLYLMHNLRLNRTMDLIYSRRINHQNWTVDMVHSRHILRQTRTTNLLQFRHNFQQECMTNTYPMNQRLGKNRALRKRSILSGLRSPPEPCRLIDSTNPQKSFSISSNRFLTARLSSDLPTHLSAIIPSGCCTTSKSSGASSNEQSPVSHAHTVSSRPKQ